MKTVNNRIVPTTDDLAQFGKCDWTESLCNMMEELANTLGATEDADALALGPSSGTALAITGTPTTGISFACTSVTTAISIANTFTTGLAIGTSGTNATLATYASKAISVYTTCASTDASNSVEPFLMYSTMTGAGGVGGRARFYMTTNVALGGWSNALKAQVVYGSSGRTTGLGSAFCAELTLSAGTSSGNYALFEGELNMGSSGVCGTATQLFYLSINDAAATTFDTNGYFMRLTGHTAGAGKFVSLTSQTVKCLLSTSTTRYLLLSQMQDGLGLGASGSAMVLTTYANHAVEIYTTSASTDASNSVEPFLLESTMTGVGGVGGRAKFYMTTNVALGGWSNALKAQVVYGASGRTTGLGSAFCAEMTLSAGTTQGNYAPLELELNAGTGASCGTMTAFMYLSMQGDGVATPQASAYLFKLAGVGSASAGNLFDTCVATPASHALRILIDSTPYYIMLTNNVDDT